MKIRKIFTFVIIAISLFILMSCKDTGPKKYTVMFTDNDQTVLDEIIVEHGEYISNHKTPTKDWYVFEGWFLDDEDTPFDFENTVILKSINLVARWKETEYRLENTFRTYITRWVQDINPHNNLVSYATIMSDTLYYLDLDWDLIVESGALLESDRGDLSKINYSHDTYNSTTDLPVSYYPSMALETPVNINEDGFFWRISLRDDLKFIDGTTINAQTFSDSYRLLLDPLLKNKYAGDLFAIKNAMDYNYITPEKTLEWSEVGFTIVTDYVFDLEFETRKTDQEVMKLLSKISTSVVHVENYELGLSDNGTFTTYGTMENPHVSFGVYELLEWSDSGFVFKKNPLNHRADEYRIMYIKYDNFPYNTDVVELFNGDRFDVVNLDDKHYKEFMSYENLLVQPTTTTYRLGFSTLREGANRIIDNPEFRKALYLAIDRDKLIEDLKMPFMPTQGYLNDLYYSSPNNHVSYRNSDPGKAVLEPFAGDSNGYDPVEAKRLFDEAVAKEVLEGRMETDSKVIVEYMLAIETEFQSSIANWLSAQFESVFGSENFELSQRILYSYLLTEGTDIYESGDFDLHLFAWQGLQFNAPYLLQVFSSVYGSAYMPERGFDTGNAPLSVELPKAKEKVIELLMELEAITPEERTDLEKERIQTFTWFIDMFGDEEESNIWFGTYDELWDHVYNCLVELEYENKDDEMNHITAALEEELFSQVIAIPLYSLTNVTAYGERITFEFDAYHYFLGWGGFKYMYFNR